MYYSIYLTKCPFCFVAIMYCNGGTQPKLNAACSVVLFCRFLVYFGPVVIPGFSSPLLS